MFAGAGGRKVAIGQQPSHGIMVFIVGDSVAGAWLRGGDSSGWDKKGVLALCHL